MAGDWIRLHRKLLESQVFQCGNDFLFRLFIWCLLRANWQAIRKDDREIKRGQFVTTRSEAADWLGCKPSTGYKGLQKLAEWGMISLECNSLGTVITVCNYDTYQTDKEGGVAAKEQRSNSEVTAKEQRSNSEATLSFKEKKKDKKEKNNVVVDDVLFNRFWAVFPARRKRDKGDAKKAWKEAIRKADPEVIITAAAEYAASPLGQGDFAKMPGSWLRSEAWDDDRAAWSAEGKPKPDRLMDQSRGLLDFVEDEE